MVPLFSIVFDFMVLLAEHPISMQQKIEGRADVAKTGSRRVIELALSLFNDVTSNAE